jgi:ketosteroid isomerase-like protein
MTDTRQRFDAWVQEYLQAWESNDPEDIGRLFSEEADYFTSPWRKPWRGRAPIVQGWLERKDPPGTWSFEYEVVTAEGSQGVVRGVTRYDEPDPDYVNLWLIRLDDTGRCDEFVEYWMEIK